MTASKAVLNYFSLLTELLPGIDVNDIWKSTDIFILLSDVLEMIWWVTSCIANLLYNFYIYCLEWWAEQMTRTSDVESLTERQRIVFSLYNIYEFGANRLA